LWGWCDLRYGAGTAGGRSTRGGSVIRVHAQLRAITAVALLAAAGVLGTSGHPVARGETLSSIAARYGISPAALAAANGITDPNRIVAGRTLVIPTGPAAARTAVASTHVVKSGETLASIAKKYGTTTSALASANGIKNPNLVVIGAKLTIPAGAGAPASGPSTAAVGTHVVKAGDTLAGIAARYGTTVAQLRLANGIVGDRIYVGTRLLLAPRNDGVTAAPAAGGVHVVQAGETLSKIATRYGTTASALAAANGIANPNNVLIGTKLQVPAGGSAAPFLCPVPGATFFNDWGFPRSGGRFHEGNDLFAPRGTPVLAPMAGNVTQTTGTVGGHQFRLTGANGTVFFGSHLDRFGKGGAIAAGDVVGYVGDSGNAKGGRTHLHFEVHPHGGPAVNPYPSIVGHC
jgi:LysM repeat protein